MSVRRYERVKWKCVGRVIVVGRKRTWVAEEKNLATATSGL